MNTETSDIETEAQDAAETEERPRRAGGALAAFALLIALGAMAGTGWMWWQDQGDSEAVAARLDTAVQQLERADSNLRIGLQEVRDRLEALPSEDAAAEILEDFDRRLDATAARIEGLEAALDEHSALARSLRMAATATQERLKALESAVGGMASRRVEADRELDVAEVEYLLRLAQERLELFADVAAADTALELADRQLAALDNPVYLGVRQEISAARRELGGVSVPDYFTIANELDAAQAEARRLPFPGEAATGNRAAPNAEGWWTKLKGVFANLVTVRRSSGETAERLSLQDRDHIRHRLWLQMELARLALMRRDGESFDSALGRAQGTMATWFDDGTQVFEKLDARLEKLRSLKIEPELPEISGPWETLHAVRKTRDVYAPVDSPQSDTSADFESEESQAAERAESGGETE